MIKRVIIVAFLILSFTQFIFAQEYNSLPGYLVTITNDTIRGFFKDRSDLKKSISFRKKDKQNFIIYSPQEVACFRIDNGPYYKSMVVTFDSLKSEKFFLKVLAQGYMSLYEAENDFFLVQKGEERYILEKKEDKLKRVDNESSEGVRTIVIEDKRYQGMMIFLVGDCPKLKGKINDLPFSPSDFTRIVNDYNNCKEPEAEPQKMVKAKRGYVTYGLKFTWLMNDMENYIKSGRYYNDNFTKTPCLSGGLIINFNLNRKLSVQTEVLLTQRKSAVYSENLYGIQPEVIKWNMVYAELPVSLYYTFPLKKVQPHILAGVVLGSKIIDNSKIQTIYSDVTKMEPMELGYRFGTGLTFKISRNTKLRFEYYYELTRTNITYIRMTYHQLANNFSVSALF